MAKICMYFLTYGMYIYKQYPSYHHLVEYGGSRAGRRQVEGRGRLLQGRHTHILTHVIHVVRSGHLAHKKSYKNESCTYLKLLPSKINATLIIVLLRYGKYSALKSACCK